MVRELLRDDRGQTVVLVALLFTVLLGFAAASVDVGRFYSERRFLQDAVDAAALACARSYAISNNVTTAWNAGDAVLRQNLDGNPLGLVVTWPAQGSEKYQDNIVTPRNLISGILPTVANGVGCRVAVTVSVPTYMIKIVSPALNVIPMTTRAYAKSKGGLLPTVVQRYANPPGPGNGNPNQFIDHIMADNFDWQCTVSNPAACTVASESTPGREFIIFGQNAKATNDSSFRGYIGLDVRDFTSEDFFGNLIHEAYNGLTGTETVNTLKDFEAAWIREGYPGPDICVVDFFNFLPCAQISVLNGSNSGIFVEEYYDRYRVGDKLLLQLYDGTVKTVPDFSMTPPTFTLTSNTNDQSTSIQYTYSPQFELSGSTVNATLIRDDGSDMTDDTGDLAANPFLNGCATAGTFNSNPTPGGAGSSPYAQSWLDIDTGSCVRGVYTAWVRGEATAPYTNRVHEALVTINVDGQLRDYNLDSSDAYISVPSIGTQANFNIRVRTSAGGSTKWTKVDALTLKWARCPRSVQSPLSILICGIDGNFAVTSITDVDPGEDHVFNVQTTLANAGETYRGWVRATGLDENNRRVSHLLEVFLDVDVTSGGVTQYVDVIGYAVFQVTAIDSNDVTGRAVTGAYLDPNDPAVAIGKKISLVPWELP